MVTWFRLLSKNEASNNNWAITEWQEALVYFITKLRVKKIWSYHTHLARVGISTQISAENSNDLKKCQRVDVPTSLLAEVSHDEAKWNDRRETSAGFRRVVWWSRRPNFWSKLTGFQNRFCLMCNARALLDCTLTIIEPTVDYCSHEICEFRNFSLWSTASTLGDKCIKK